MQSELQQLYGNIDIYLFDQLLKGTYDNCRKILDAGCGGGGNLGYFFQNGFYVFGIEPKPNAVAAVQQLVQDLTPNIPQSNFKVATAEHMPFGDAEFDLIVSSAVLHFAQSK